MLYSIRTFSAFLLLGLFLITACEDNPGLSTEEPPQDPPQIPSAQTMTVEMDEFDQQDSQQKTGASATTQSENAFLNAAFRAGIVKGVVDANLAIPKALLKAAASSEAEFNEDGEWVWAYSLTEGEQSYEVSLVATELNENEVKWDFYVTNTEQGLDDQLFFSGVANAGGEEGTWTYYYIDGEFSDEETSTIEWVINGEDDVQIRLDVLSEQSDYTGSYLEYTFDGTIKHALFYNSLEETTAEIQLNVETNEGFLIAPQYNNGEKACWDSEFQDTVCEE